MKVGFWLAACVAAKGKKDWLYILNVAELAKILGCGRKCTKTWFDDTIQCSETATTAKEFAACFFKSGDAYVKVWLKEAFDKNLLQKESLLLCYLRNRKSYKIRGSLQKRTRVPCFAQNKGPLLLIQDC